VVPGSSRWVELVTASHTFSPRRPDRGSLLLLRAVAQDLERLGWRGGRILDLGAGYGLVGLVLAERFPCAQVDLVEINDRAVACLHENIARLGLSDRARVWHQDASSFAPKERFGVVVTNPPIRAGRKVYGPWLTSAHRLLEPGGLFYLVGRTAQGVRTLERLLASSLGDVHTVEREGGYRVVRGQLPLTAPNSPSPPPAPPPGPPTPPLPPGAFGAAGATPLR
jgi:16S rRNA (guanine1207-N2)-methyltransferase